jgi:hypothetical protein
MSAIGSEARRFLRTQQNGVLSTISRRMEGYPFGSVAPFMTDHAGCPVILISTIAEHTKNIESDPRVSLITQPFSTDMQEMGRVTLVGHARQLPDKDRLGPRYLRRFPQAEHYFAMHDFQFYRLEPIRVRYIGGFGKIHWLEPDAYLCAAGHLDAVEDSIIEHMNRDHADTLQVLCNHFLGVPGQEATMIGIDPDGFDLRSEDHIHRIAFTEQVLDADAARHALVTLSRGCHP